MVVFFRFKNWEGAKKFFFKIWYALKNSNQILTSCKKLACSRTHFYSIDGKLDALQRSSFKIWRLIKLLTQIFTRCKNIPSKKNYLQKKFGAKVTTFKSFDSKPDGVLKSWFKIWLFSELLICNLLFFAITFFRRIKRFKWAEKGQFWSCYRVKR